MTPADAKHGGARAALVSRRDLFLERAGIVAILAVPVGAVVATAQPIPNAPDRKTLAALSPTLQSRLEQRLALVKSRKRKAKQKNRDRAAERAARQRQRAQRLRDREELRRSRPAR